MVKTQEAVGQCQAIVRLRSVFFLLGLWVKGLATVDLKTGCYTRFHPSGQVPSSGIQKPGLRSEIAGRHRKSWEALRFTLS